jgi:hypothetical protein
MYYNVHDSSRMCEKCCASNNSDAEDNQQEHKNSRYPDPTQFLVRLPGYPLGREGNCTLK